METWIIIIIIISISISVLLKLFTDLLFNTRKPTHKLPPGPFTIPIISNFLLVRKSLFQLSHILRPLHAKLGPIVTLHIGPCPVIFISDHTLAHQALIQNGAVFASRPSPLAMKRVISTNQLSVNANPYGPTWRLLRRNLAAEILHPARVKSFAPARKWVLQTFIERLKDQSKFGDPVGVPEDFRYCMAALFVLMCFGEKVKQEQIEEIKEAQLSMMMNLGRQFKILNFWPRLTKVLFCKRWEEFYKLRKHQQLLLNRLIQERKEKLSKAKESEGDHITAYVDSLFDLQLPEQNNRRLNEGESISLCSEFLNAGTDTSTALSQWVMANLVKYPHIQEKLYMEIRGVVGEGEKEVKEEDLQNMPYLKAVTLEVLRRHPPAHLGLPHAVTEDVILNGFLIPKNASIYFMVAEMGWDSKVWEDPMAFKPERFLTSSDDVNGGEMFDLTGSREIKMMPFGVGRRICPGLNLGLLHLEYFVANLVWCFEWKAVEGDEISLEEKQAVTVVMKHSLQTRLCPRSK